MNGIELLNKLREQQPRAKIILASTEDLTGPKERDECLSLGFSESLKKPFSINEWNAMLARLATDPQPDRTKYGFIGDAIYPVEDKRFPPDYSHYNPIIYDMWCFMADKIERDPSLLRTSIENMDRLIKKGIWGQDWLARWRRMIEWAQTSDDGLMKLVAFLRSDSEESRQMKSYSSFAGVLTQSERDQFSCSWTH